MTAGMGQEGHKEGAGWMDTSFEGSPFPVETGAIPRAVSDRRTWLLLLAVGTFSISGLWTLWTPPDGRACGMAAALGEAEQQAGYGELGEQGQLLVNITSSPRPGLIRGHRKWKPGERM